MSDPRFFWKGHVADHQQDLLAAAQRGDVAALNRLVAMQRQGIYRYGLRVCRTTEDAEDAVQETLWAATRAIRTFRGTASSIASWMFTIVRRECLRLLEGRRRAPDDLEELERLPSNTPHPENEAVARRRTALLASVIAELDPGHREVILLRDIQELSAPEAAKQLGLSVDALKSRLHRARESLREGVLRRSDEF
jgi:RNA polymerase sigma-70 factor, ECF subfamily